MLKKFIKIFIPHESNSFHPHTTRRSSILGYALILVFLNYVIFPAFGIKYTNTLASDINPLELVNLANKERKDLGISELSKNDVLGQAASLKGEDMLLKQYWSHFGPNGETPWQFIKEVGYSYVYAGENLAKDFYADIDAHTAWMQSKTHRENLLNPNFKDIGIATVTGELQGYTTTIIIVMFGSQFGNLTDNVTNSLSAPQILKPASGTQTDKSKVLIEGKAEFGDTLKVFSNGKLLGELPKENAAFTINVELLEKENEIYIKSEDSKSGLESNKSNSVILKLSSGTSPPGSSSLLGTSTFQSNSNGDIKSIVQKVKHFSLGQIINSVFILFFSFFVLIDLLFLSIKGIRRDFSAHHSFHFALILIVAIGILTI